MQVDLVAPEDLDGALRDWERLQDSDPRVTPFSSSAWARVWLEHWDPAAEPWVMRVRDGERVAGIAPLVLRRRLGIRVLSMLGKEPGDYWDVIAAPDDRPQVAATVGAGLSRLGGGWDVGIVSCLPEGSQTLEDFGRAGLRVYHRPAVRSPAIRLPASFEEYLQTLPPSRRSNLRRHLNRLDRGDVVLREVSAPAEVPEALSSWRELRSRQWRAAGRQINPSHEEDRFYRFMVAVTQALMARGLTSLWQLFSGDRLAGVYLNFCDERSFYWYLGGYDPELSRLGVGKIAVAATLRASIEAGRQWYDFTRGEDAYKYWYGARDRHLVSAALGHARPRSRVTLGVAGLIAGRRDRRYSRQAESNAQSGSDATAMVTAP